MLINFFMFVISVLLALDEVAYDKCAGLRIERTRYETSLTKVLHAFVVFFGNTLRFVFLQTFAKQLEIKEHLEFPSQPH